MIAGRTTEQEQAAFELGLILGRSQVLRELVDSGQVEKVIAACDSVLRRKHDR